MKLIHWNILDGALDRWHPCHQWLERMQPDALALCECNGWDLTSARERLAPLGLTEIAFLPTRWGYHLCWASREPIQTIQTFTDGFWHGALHVRHRCFDAILTHLAPGNEPDRVAVRTSEADALVAHLQRCDRPVLLSGDLNCLSPLDADVLLAEGDPSDVRDTAVARLLAAGLRDPGAGVSPRWSVPTAISGHDWRRRIDYVLVSPELAPRCGPAVIHQEEPLPWASDHYPVAITIAAGDACGF